MNISTAIKILQNILDEHGDLPLWISHEWTEPLMQDKYCGIHYEPEYIHKFGKEELFPERVEIT